MSGESLTEALTVNMLGITLTISTADWGAYLAEPANIVAFVVAIGVTLYNGVRIVHYLKQIKNK